MNVQDIIYGLRHLKVETGSIACLGCGHEHSCSTRGCAIIRAAADELARLNALDQLNEEGSNDRTA